jgi:hypothetical protein
MSWINEVTDVLQRYRNAPASTAPDSAPADFAKVAEHAPPAVISSGLAEAFRSPSTPPFSQMVSQLFGQSDTGQRAGILNHLIAAAGPAALSGGLLGSLTGALSGPRPSITPEQAQQVDPAAVRQLAEHAQKQDPSIVDRAGEFYAQHPKLVQGLGAAALALVMSHVSQRH